MRAVIRREGRLVVDEMAPPALGPGLVRCRTLACGICGSDLHALDHLDHMLKFSGLSPDDIGKANNADMVFGHEFCCEVVELGPGAARGLKPGARVVSIPVIAEGATMETIGYSTRRPGGFAQEMVLQEALLLEVPNGLPAEHAALTEPLAVGEHAVAMAGLTGQEGLLVIGCGPVGLAVIDALRGRGLGPIFAADFSPTRRALAEKLGADAVIDPAVISPHASWRELGVAPTRADALMAQMAGQTPKKPVIFECVGAPGVLQKLAAEAPVGTRMIVVGVCMETDAIEPLLFVSKEIELRFVLGYNPVEFGHALTRLARGETGYHQIVTRVVDLEETPLAFMRLQTDKSEVKVIVSPNA